MIPVIALTYIAYAMAIARGVTFFRTQESCREADKHIVGAIIAGGVMFMVFQTLVWLERPNRLFGKAMLDSIWVAFNFFNAAFYLTLAHLFTRTRSCRANQQDRAA